MDSLKEKIAAHEPSPLLRLVGRRVGVGRDGLIDLCPSAAGVAIAAWWSNF